VGEKKKKGQKKKAVDFWDRIEKLGERATPRKEAAPGKGGGRNNVSRKSEGCGPKGQNKKELPGIQEKKVISQLGRAGELVREGGKKGVVWV